MFQITNAPTGCDLHRYGFFQCFQHGKIGALQGSIFTDIGKKYYKNPNEDPAALKELCDDIDTRRRRIKKMKFELNGIRGCKVCPKCNAEVNERFQFCGRCGARLPDIEDDDFMSLEPNDYYTESSNQFFNADSTKNF